MNNPFNKKYSGADWYEIEIEGYLDSNFSEWFDGLAITHPVSDKTCISGRVVDQAALHGLLSKVRDLNMRLISVKLCRKKKKRGVLSGAKAGAAFGILALGGLLSLLREWIAIF